MQIYINKIFASILSLPRYSKKSIAILSDICLCILATWIALVLRLDKENIHFLNSIFIQHLFQYL